ncbi:MAG: fatty-acyl-CoA synthase [Actinomycetota bacterium]|jgi:fatty-acyl-CoA synthase|nr:fatty-acyl-CoA synthase [Actinomycetota bacterium]
MTALRSSTVADVVRRTAGRVPGRVALRFDGREWTYHELDAAITRAAAFLLGLGLAKGDRVAAYGKNSDAYLIGFLACARAGLVHVPINYNLTGDELAYLLTQSGSTVALVDPALKDNLSGVEQVVLLRDGENSLLSAASEGEVPDLDVDVADTDLVQLLYTSGTTSKPKGAMMTHRALVHEYLSCLQALDLHENDDPLHVMPLYHSAQMHVFLLPWLAIGATNDLMEVPEPGEILRRLEKNGHVAFFAAPTLWVALTNHPDFATRDLGSLRKAYYGASIMPGPIVERLAAAMPELGFYNCFGQSEIGPLATVLGPADHADRPDSAGRPVLFVEARVVDELGNDVAPDEPGEVVYRSPQLCLGYWDKPEDTAEAFRDGWFHSGDLVRKDEEGYFFVVDRIKDVINTGGVLVASREVEDALYTHSAVGEVAVIGLPDEKWIEAVTAVVVSKEDVGADELMAHVRGRLASFKLPKAVHFVDELPRNASGKILKRELRERFS